MNRTHGFHEGERKAQRRAGEAGTAARNVAMVAERVIGPLRPFIARQSMVALGSIADDGSVWASLVFAPPGFASTDDDGSAVRLTMGEGNRDPAEPFWTNVRTQADVGMLFIELATRRRFRVNGRIARRDAEGIEVTVAEAYPNCPKYIHTRDLPPLTVPARDSQVAQGTLLRGDVADLVKRADTLFIASAHAADGADVSHRGGHEGFVQIIDERTLRMPDYPGNSMFNTTGNLVVNPRAGLCIPDFVDGRLLQLTGTATPSWGDDDDDDLSGGTGRFLTFHIDRWLLRDAMPAFA